MIALTILSITNYNTCAIAWVLLAAFLEIRRERKKELKAETFTNKKENLYNLFELYQRVIFLYY